jgi:hypothetical protein
VSQDASFDVTDELVKGKKQQAEADKMNKVKNGY